MVVVVVVLEKMACFLSALFNFVKEKNWLVLFGGVFDLICVVLYCIILFVLICFCFLFCFCYCFALLFYVVFFFPFSLFLLNPPLA